MVVSGVRSSWLASATKRRTRSSEPRAAASEAALAPKAASIWASMPLSAVPSRPISVRGSRSGTRLESWPAAMAPAVCSISTSGRRLARTIATPIPTRISRTPPLTVRSMAWSRPMVLSMLSSAPATTSVPPEPSAMGSIRTRQRPPPLAAWTVKGVPACASR